MNSEYNDLQTRIIYYMVAYISNFEYTLLLLIIALVFEFPHNPYYSLLIFGVPASISMLISAFIIRNNLTYGHSRNQGIIRLALAHSLSIIGLVLALLYLFYF